MNFNILTIFPDLFDTLDHGVIGRAKKNGSFSINLHDIRKYAVNKHGQIDGKPYGGGEGMLMMPQPLKKSLEDIPKNKIGKVIYLSPQGKPLNNIKAKELSTEKSIKAHWKNVNVITDKIPNAINLFFAIIYFF